MSQVASSTPASTPPAASGGILSSIENAAGNLVSGVKHLVGVGEADAKAILSEVKGQFAADLLALVQHLQVAADNSVAFEPALIADGVPAAVVTTVVGDINTYATVLEQMLAPVPAPAAQSVSAAPASAASSPAPAAAEANPGTGPKV